jgi:hypothetical protein
LTDSYAPQIGYHTAQGTLDSIPYACAYCEVPLFFNKMRMVPDDFCRKCYELFSPQRGEDGKYDPWLQFLITKERSRRIKLLRYRKRGIDYSPVSFEEYLSYPDALSEEQQDEEW